MTPEKYWTKVLGMAEPKYCANGAYDMFVKGWIARGEQVADMKEALRDCAAEMAFLIEQTRCSPGGAARRAYRKARAALDGQG
jgi:hypothetical protein